MELKDYQQLAGNENIIKYELVINQREDTSEVKKKKCLVLADTKAMIALVVEDDPEVIINVGIGSDPRSICLSDKLGYPNVWRGEIDDSIHCEMFASFDEETAIDMIKNTILLEIDNKMIDYEVLKKMVRDL